MFTMTFRGLTLPIKVKEIEGRGPSGLQPTILRNNDGSERRVSKVSELDKQLKVSFTLNSNNREDLLDKSIDLSEMLYSVDFEPIVFSDEPNLIYYGILSGSIDWAEGEHRGDGVITFERQPYKEGAELTTSSYNGFSNPGNVPVYPIIEITLNQSTNNLKVLHEDGFINIIWGFLQSDKIVIDLVKRKLIINGNVRMSAYDWSNIPFKLKQGQNSISFDKDVVGPVNIRFKPKWR